MATKEVTIILLALFALIFVHVSYGQEDQPINDPDDPGEDPTEDPVVINRPKNVTRDDFPKDFIFGTTSSAYQFEGAAHEDGKGDSIWDVFTANNRDKIKDNSSGDIAEDFYHRYPEDLPIMQYLGFNAFRFSISWPRILPNGTKNKGVNDAGIRYYRRLIDKIIENGQEPFATIFHWDLPQALENEYQGFLNKKIVDDFRDYAEFCFSLFGNKVKNWITINEPWSYSTLGYAQGIFPPNRCSKGMNKGLGRQYTFLPGRFASYADQAECKEGNSGTEPYIVSHHLLLAHAKAVKVYRENFQHQKGQIGISLCTEWYKPRDTKNYRDQWAKDRAIAWMYGWFMEPLTHGHYPKTMVQRVGDRLPNFTKEDSEMVKGSADFIGLNYYTAKYVAASPNCTVDNTYMTDPCVFTSNVSATGEPIGNKTYLDWLYIYPDGIKDILKYGQRMYKNPPMYITENGVDRQNLGNDPQDFIREDYHENHMAWLPKMIKEGVKIKGYFVWSYMDNFEWLDGYTVNFGLIYVDHKNNTLNRTCKDSAKWFKNFLGSNQTLDLNTTYANCDMN